MSGHLLLRGLIAGLIAGLVAFGFARVYGEPQVERAIAFEELMAAAEAIEHHRPLKTSPRLEPVLALLRSKIAPLTEDRYLAPDLAAATEFVLSGAVGKAAGLDSFAECSA